MTEHYDVLIVGAGASGALAAQRFARAGMKVLCLEQGEWIKPDSYSGGKPDWELQRRQRFHHNPNIRLSEADYPCDIADSDVEMAMWNGVGGSTILWTAHWHRMLPSDFRVKTLDGVASDWPINYDDLVPYYEQLEQEMGVSGVPGDPAQPPMRDFPLPPLPIGKAGKRIAQGMNRLGWHWWPGSHAIPSKPFKNLNPCARLGVCQSGCPEGAKVSADLLHMPEAIAAGAKLVTGARVSEIQVSGNGLAKGVAWIDRGGESHQVDADIVILCANGVGTPRLLLMSKNGLANSSGLVGKGLMLHPFAAVQGIFPDDMESWAGPAGELIYSLQFYESDPTRGHLRGGKWALLPAGHAVTSHPGLLGLSMEQGWGAAGLRAVNASVGKSCVWILMTEDLPLDENRVELSSDMTDSDGLPSPRIVYRVGENSRKLLDWHTDRADESMKAAGAIATIKMPGPLKEAGHLMGTARMGTDPSRSVVDPFCRTHDIPNLYILDGSPFVTGAAVNPTATIMANAARCIEEIIARRREQRTAA